MDRRVPRRQVLVSLALVVALGFGGCLTLSPSVTADTGSSAVFESISTNEPWVSGRMKASVSLAPNATTTGDVTKLVVISASGSSFDTVTLDSGQTSATVYVPANGNATIVATDTVNGTVVETQPVTTDGNKIL